MSKTIKEGLCSNLMMLRLSENHIKDDGANMMAESLKYLPKLATLDLSRNMITETGMNHIQFI